jgi:hypothetical protein
MQNSNNPVTRAEYYQGMIPTEEDVYYYNGKKRINSSKNPKRCVPKYSMLFIHNKDYPDRFILERRIN